MAGLTRGTVRWGESRPATNAWASSGGGSSSDVIEDDYGEAARGGGGKKGKGRKGKQTLFHFG